MTFAPENDIIMVSITMRKFIFQVQYSDNPYSKKGNIDCIDCITRFTVYAESKEQAFMLAMMFESKWCSENPKIKRMAATDLVLVSVQGVD